MPHSADKVPANALPLPPGERENVAASSLESLDDAVDDVADKAWAAKIQRRLHEVDVPQLKLIPWEEARRIIRGDR